MKYLCLPFLVKMGLAYSSFVQLEIDIEGHCVKNVKKNETEKQKKILIGKYIIIYYNTI